MNNKTYGRIILDNILGIGGMILGIFITVFGSASWFGLGKAAFIVGPVIFIIALNKWRKS